MKLWKKYKSCSLKKQRILFLLCACMILLHAFMWMPVSAAQTGLPDFAKETVLEVSVGGNRPTISTKDPCFTDAQVQTVWTAISELQSALEDAAFYPRSVALSPMCWLFGKGSWMEIKTESGTYRIGTVHNRGFVEINGVQHYYRNHDEWDRLGKQCDFWDAFYQLSYYFADVSSAYHNTVEAN